MFRVAIRLSFLALVFLQSQCSASTFKPETNNLGVNHPGPLPPNLPEYIKFLQSLQEDMKRILKLKDFPIVKGYRLLFIFNRFGGKSYHFYDIALYTGKNLKCDAYIQLSEEKPTINRLKCA